MATNSAETAAAPDTKVPVIIDLGKHRRKRIRDLRKGTGKLAAEVNGAIEELRAAGTVSPNSQTVVVIVRQRRRRSAALRNLLPGL